jgi:hypothetical protein
MTAGVVPNLDSVAEFRLITNSFDAEYGRFSGAVMNAITKTGTNGLHGAAFEFLRNSNMDARAFFDPAVTVLKRNQFGYAVGGPALKNRLFWFTDYQGTRERRGTSGSLSQLPSVAQRSGVFTPSDLNGEVSGPYWAQVLSKRLGYAVSANEPYSTPTCTSTAACVFPGGVIPASAISPISANLLKNYIRFLTPERTPLIRQAWSIVSPMTRPGSAWTTSVNARGTGTGITISMTPLRPIPAYTAQPTATSEHSRRRGRSRACWQIRILSALRR